jgi:acyl-CoA synthetase (AMP-forming)/AMP-acid ligase II
MLNLAILLEDSAREVPERTAIVCEGTRLSYAELDAAASQAAHGLVQAGIQQGDTVALSCQDIPSFVIAYYGILKAGAAVMPLNVLLKPREIAYHLTGDIGRRDEDGYIYIVDRVKDMIIRGGFNVYPREIEEVLMTHPAVSLAAVIGVSHDRHGEEVKAFVIVKDGATITEVELVAWSKQNMADYKYPRLIEFRTELPMTATGKVLKSELRS